MTFSTLALITALGMLGPLLSAKRQAHIPLVLGPVLGGLVFGASGFRVLDANEPTFHFLANMGFAIVMFIAGTHIPVRSPAVRSALGAGALRAAGIGVVAAFIGTGLSALFGTGHAALYAVLMASSSTSILLSVISMNALMGKNLLTLIAQVAIADVACIISLPLAINPPAAPRAALGVLAVGAGAFAIYLFLRWSESSGLRGRVQRFSEERGYALQLRISLVGLFLLTAIATTSRISVMIAGFSLGLAVAAVGEPRQMASQLFAVGEGFLGPLFSVWIGSVVDLRNLIEHPKFIVLGLALGLGSLLAHGVMRLAGIPGALAFLTAAQVSLPVAAVTVGEDLHLLAAGEGAALLLGGMLTIAGVTVAAGRATRVAGDPPTVQSSA